MRERTDVLYVSHKGDPVGVNAINMSDCAVEMVVKNGSAHYVENSHIAAYRRRQIKAKVPGKEVVIIAGDGKEGNCNGRAKDASFSQPFGICVELDMNIFVTDVQTGCVKLITTVKGAALLKELNTSYEVDLHSCLTVQVENLHAMGHFKDQFPTSLQHARNGDLFFSVSAFNALLTLNTSRGRQSKTKNKKRMRARASAYLAHT